MLGNFGQDQEHGTTNLRRDESGLNSGKAANIEPSWPASSNSMGTLMPSFGLRCVTSGININAA